MTIEEKREVLQNFCEIHNACKDCVLRDCHKGGCKFTGSFDSMKDELVEQAYNLAFGGEEVNDNVNHPTHYQGKNECIDVMIAMFGKEAVKHFCMCNAYKYRFRADKKNGSEDIAKAEWYETKLIELGGVE